MIIAHLLLILYFLFEISIKNAIEEHGGFIDISLTPKLLQVSPEYFLDLLVAVSDEQSRDDLKKRIRKQLHSNMKDTEFFDAKPFGTQCKSLASDTFVAVLQGVLTGGVSPLVGSLINAVRTAIEQ